MFKPFGLAQPAPARFRMAHGLLTANEGERAKIAGGLLRGFLLSFRHALPRFIGSDRGHQPNQPGKGLFLIFFAALVPALERPAGSELGTLIASNASRKFAS